MTELLSFFAEHWILTGLFVCLFACLMFIELQTKSASGIQMTPGTLVACLNHENGHVLDIRSKELFLQGHIIGAEHADPLVLAGVMKKLHKQKKHPVILCGPDRGKIVTQCMKTLKQHDFQDVRVLQGGMNAWLAAGMPVEGGK